MNLFISQRGLSLIELMIGILLGSLLLLGVLQIFQSNSDTLRMQNGFSRVQESGRFAVDMLSKEIRQAGFWGCAENKNIENLSASADKFYSSIGGDDIGVAGQDNVATNTKVEKIEVIEGTDILTLSGAEDACAGKGRMLNGTDKGDIVVSDSCPIKNNDIVIVSNCKSGSVFTVLSTTETAGHKKLNYPAGIVFKEEYGVDSKILTPYEKVFFIASGAQNTNSLNTNSLFMKDEAGNVQELVPGIDDMQVSYGVDTNGNGIVNQWQAADDVIGMAGVTAIKIELLVSSDSVAGVDKQTITRLDGSKKEYDDGLLRKLYVATVKVRNRGSM
ncbi:PilW family protein [Microbulbifer sp. ANSA001]|uniref:PilW family protein n=1 Tax=Microbulbifer sp. ANSA001 TaxID=3243358 RepID=UPI004042032B